MTPPTLRDVTNEPPKPPRAPRRARFDPPGWLSAPAKVAFRRIVADIEAETPGVIARRDLPALALLAQVYAVAQAASKAMRGAGNADVVLSTDSTHGAGTDGRKTPAWQVLNQAVARYQALARDFGLTLSARQRLELDVGVPILGDEQDDLDRALG